MNCLPPNVLTPFLVALTVGFGACAPNDGGQVGEETQVCQSVQETTLDTSEESPLGFAAEELLGAVSGARQIPIRWEGGDASQLSLELNQAGVITFQDREWVDSQTGEEAGSGGELGLGDCDDVLVAEMQMRLITDDGRLDETWPVLVLATSGNTATISYSFDTVNGSLDIASFAPDGEIDALSAYVDVEFSASVVSGSIYGQAESSDGDTVSSARFAIANFGP
jgi:hypothetical protein